MTGYAQFVDDDGDSIGGGGPPTFGVSWTDDGPFRLVDDGRSRAPRRAGEVAMDAATAREHGFAVGDGSGCCSRARRRNSGSSGCSASATASTSVRSRSPPSTSRPPRARSTPTGALDRIYVQRDPDVSQAELQRRIQGTLGQGFEVLTAGEAAEQVGEPVREFLGFFTFALLGFAAIGVVVGAFVIFNTFTILVAQRTRELGLLRAMGASGGQVVGSVVLEALLVVVAASLIGLAFGVLLGVGLLELLRALGLKLPETSTVLLGRTVIVSLVVGIVVTVAAAVLPAAARRARAAGGRDQRRAPRAHASLRRRVVVGCVIVAVGVAVLVFGLARAESVTGLFEQVQVVALGAFALLVGVVVLLAAVARPSRARSVGRCARSAPAACSPVRTRCGTRAAPRSPRRRWSSASRWWGSPPRSARRPRRRCARTPLPGCAPTTW